MAFFAGRSLTRDQGGAARVQIPCSKCRLMVDLETRNECPRCGTVLRRCVDCRHFDRAWNYCSQLDTNVRPKQAREPGKLAISYNCQSFEQIGPGATPSSDPPDHTA